MIRDIALHDVKGLTLKETVRLEHFSRSFVARHLEVTTPDGIFTIRFFGYEPGDLDLNVDLGMDVASEDMDRRLKNAIHGEATALVRIADLEKEIERLKAKR